MTIDDTTQRLLMHLQRGGTFGYYWIVSTAKGKDKQPLEKITTWHKATDVPRFPAERNGHGPRHLYFGVNPTLAIPTERTNTRTGEVYQPRPDKVRPEIDEIAAVNALYGDFDAKDFGGDKDAALDHIEVGLPEIGVPPASVMVDSGGGYQNYWLLAKPFILDTPEKRERARRLQERWVPYIGSDPSVHDLPRVLRLPQTHNWKYDPAPVTSIVYADFDRLYTFEELEALIPSEEPPTTREAPTRGPVTSAQRGHLQRWVDERITIACNEIIVNAPSGDGSNARVRGGKLAGGIVHHGIYTEQEIIDKLMHSAMQRSSDNERETERNLWQGLTYGKASKIEPPPFPTDQPLIISPSGEARCPACDTLVVKSQYDYPGTTTPGWYCPTCKGVMKWPFEAHTPRLKTTEGVQGEAAAKEADTTRLSKSERVRAWLRAKNYTLRLNMAGSILECNGKPLDDYLASEIKIQYSDDDMKGIGLLEDIWRAEARRNAYHPIQDYLNGLVWDGKPHIATLAKYLTCSDPEIVYANGQRRSTISVYLYRWMIGAVAKVFDRKQNAMLVLGGPQGIGKSEFVRWLCSKLPDHYFEGQIHPGDRDSMLRFATNFIWEVAELDATTRRADRSALKGALTQESIILRKAYGHFDTRAPAIVSFIGTFNPDNTGFLDDPSGSRRFWIATLTQINWKYQQEINIDQVWAEAVAAYRSGKPWRLLAEEEQQRTQLNEEHEIDDPILDYLDLYFDLDADLSRRMTSADIMLYLNSKEVPLDYRNTRGLSTSIGRALSKRGIKRIGGNDGRSYAGIAPRE